MMIASRRTILSITTVMLLAVVMPVNAQQTAQEAQALAQKIAQQTAQKPLMAEDVFKNVQILKGIPVNQFMETMGFFAASLGLNCVYCHVPESLENWDRFADDVPPAGRSRIKLFFGNETGLLARQLRYSDTPVGTVPIQIDYSDYRAVAGVKLPFHWIVTWTNGQTLVELNDVQPHVAIAATRFGKPAPAEIGRAHV